MPRIPGNIKIYRKLRYRKGHGIHSPFVFNLITKVIEEKSPYYIFDDIEQVRKDILTQKYEISRYHDPLAVNMAKITAKEIQHKKYGALLFRLVNFFKCNSVLHVGASTGIMSYYLTSSHSNCTCIALEERIEVARFAQLNADKFGLKGLRFESGQYEESLKKVLISHPQPDMIFIDTAHDSELTEKLLTQCLNYTNKNPILIVDSIKKDKKMNALWNMLKQNPTTTVTIDLHALGIVFFHNRIHKQHYKTYFDYGKKQSLYPNRGQRFNIFGWRKKSS